MTEDYQFDLEKQYAKSLEIQGYRRTDEPCEVKMHTHISVNVHRDAEIIYCPECQIYWMRICPD